MYVYSSTGPSINLANYENPPTIILGIKHFPNPESWKIGAPKAIREFEILLLPYIFSLTYTISKLHVLANLNSSELGAENLVDVGIPGLEK